MLCSYGCNQNAPFQLKNGNWCCSDSHNKCPGMKKKNNRNSWNTGLTKETSDKLKQVGNTISTRCKLYGCPFTGKTHSQETKDKISNSASGKSHSQETKDKIRNSMIGNKHSKNQRNKKAFYKDIQMDSMWEVAVAKYLDDNNIIWKYEEKHYPLMESKTYSPDFFIYDSEDNLVKLIEVKGLFREANRIKFELFKSMYPDIVIELWQWKELLDKGIIDSSGRPLM